MEAEKVKKVKKAKRIFWTDEMKAKLAKLYPTASWEDLLKAFPKHNRLSITMRAERLGVKRTSTPEWTDEMKAKLAELFPKASWEEILKAFPKLKRGAITMQALRMGLKRPFHGAQAHADYRKEEAPKAPVTDEQIARFLTRGRSLKEVAASFSLTEKEVQERFAKGLEGYDIFTGPKNIHDDETYVAVPTRGNAKLQPKAWEWQREPTEHQPYGVITFPKDFDHTKIKLIPIDGVYFGDDAHDADRFDAVVRYIARSPSTFCYLNGDAIAEVKAVGRGREAQDARYFAYLERAAEFTQKMRPIAHKVLFAQQGCLEARALKYQGFDPLAHFCQQHKIPYFDEPIYIDIFWGERLFTLWTMHGHSTAQVKGAKINALRRPAQIHDLTHFIVMGHIGDAIWNRQVKICRSPLLRALYAKEEFLLVLGNFKKYFGTRSARRGETPSSNEIMVLFMYPSGDYHVKTLHGGHA